MPSRCITGSDDLGPVRARDHEAGLAGARLAGTRRAACARRPRLRGRPAPPTRPTERLAGRRHHDDAERRPPALGEADHHGELAVARGELARAVERIDEEDALVREDLARRHHALGRALLGEDPRLGEALGQRGADERVRLAIRARHRIAGALHLDLEGRRVDRGDEHRRAASDREHGLELVVALVSSAHPRGTPASLSRSESSASAVSRR